jgi:hypothetical protein
MFLLSNNTTTYSLSHFFVFVQVILSLSTLLVLIIFISSSIFPNNRLHPGLRRKLEAYVKVFSFIFDRSLKMMIA